MLHGKKGKWTEKRLNKIIFHLVSCNNKANTFKAKQKYLLKTGNIIIWGAKIHVQYLIHWKCSVERNHLNLNLLTFTRWISKEMQEMRLWWMGMKWKTNNFVTLEQYLMGKHDRSTWTRFMLYTFQGKSSSDDIINAQDWPKKKDVNLIVQFENKSCS